MKLPSFTSQICFIYVKDLEISRSFYEGVLGLELILDQGSCRIVKIAGDAYLGYCSVPSHQQGGEGVLITLVADDVDAWYRHLSEKGVLLLEPPRENPQYGIYHFFLYDPDGYKLEIQAFIDPNWSS